MKEVGNPLTTYASLYKCYGYISTFCRNRQVRLKTY